jgi:hypothetical protein
MFFPAALYAQILYIDKDTCRYASGYQSNTDMAFKAGEGLHGKKVAPADLASGINQDISGDFKVRLTNDLAKLFNLQLPALALKNSDGLVPVQQPLVSPEIEGFITLKNGKPFLNGKPLDAPAQEQLFILCKAENKAKE